VNIAARYHPAALVSYCRRKLAWCLPLVSVVLTVKTQCRSGRHSVTGRRATTSSQRVVTVLAWAGRAIVAVELGQQ
jgi:hypothetical protein